MPVMVHSMKKENPGISFEKVVAELQRQLDPNSEVTHNEWIVDKLGNRRQFDVVIRGKFAGQDLLGVIECKDLKKKVGTPEVDAFITKANNLNANFKVIVSKKGFTKPALKEALNYGVQTLSLLKKDHPKFKLGVGNFWFVDIYRWSQISITLQFKNEPNEPVNFDAKELSIGGKKVIDWFTNYLIDNHLQEKKLGLVVGLEVKFEKNQVINLGDGQKFECTGLLLGAERTVDKRRKFIGINGTGFLDWQKQQVMYPAGAILTSETVGIDFNDWEVRDSDEIEANGLIHISLTAFDSQFEYVNNPIALDLI